jgi:6-phosphogluconate dehydrogenase
MSGNARIGVTGLAVMGRNLARNLARNGHVVAVHNRTAARTDALVTGHGGDGDFRPAATLREFVASLERPRQVIVMVAAGAATDSVIDGLAELMEPGDIVVDGGNAHFLDTRRREADLRTRGLHLVGAGISGGEEGALTGPSIMPGGSAQAYASLRPLLESIAAEVDGTPCCALVGPDGAGHFVKMVHNGIEYADMQLISEAYHLMRIGAGMSPAEISEVFAEWNTGELNSYLVGITAEVLAHIDHRTGTPFIDAVADTAEQKGTGRWTVQTALDHGIPVSGIAEAVFARSLSGQVGHRAVIGSPNGSARAWAREDREEFIRDVRGALYATKVVAYAQGFDLIRAGSTEYGWDIDPGSLATIWRGGCIIRAAFLDRIRQAYGTDPSLPSLLVDPAFAEAVDSAQSGWRRLVAAALSNGVPAPGFTSALGYYDQLRTPRLPTALIQGLRDYFGAHGYRRTDRPGRFHTRWGQDRDEIPAGG